MLVAIAKKIILDNYLDLAGYISDRRSNLGVCMFVVGNMIT